MTEETLEQRIKPQPESLDTSEGKADTFLNEDEMIDDEHKQVPSQSLVSNENTPSVTDGTILWYCFGCSFGPHNLSLHDNCIQCGMPRDSLSNLFHMSA